MNFKESRIIFCSPITASIRIFLRAESYCFTYKLILPLHLVNMTSDWASILGCMRAIHTSRDTKSNIYHYPHPTVYGPTVFIKQVRCESEEDAYHATIEAEIARNKPHPNLCNCLGIERQPPFVYIFSEVGSKGLLEDIEERFGQDPPKCYTEEELRKLMSELVAGFARLQEQGITHQDVKPENIRLGNCGEVKIGYLCLSKEIKRPQNMKLDRCPYLSPKLREAFVQGEEHLLRIQHNAYKSDVFSLGVVFIRLICVNVPECFYDLKKLQVNIDRELGKLTDFSTQFTQLLSHMLQVEEDNRPDFLELREELIIRLMLYADDQYIEAMPSVELSTDSLNLSMKCGLQHVRISPTLQEIVPCMVSLEAITPDEFRRMESIDIICVIDESGSMGGDLIELVKCTLVNLVELLGDSDRVCIIGFSDTVERKCPLLCCTAEGKGKLKACILALTALENTNITAALQLALNVLLQRRATNSCAAILLFTDGKDNLLFNAMETCTGALDQVQIPRLSVHCFGYGNDLDAKLLEEIATHGGGVFTHITSLEDVPKAFAYTFGGLTSVMARNIHIEIKALSGKVSCRTRNMYGNDGSCSFNLLDLSTGQRKDMIFFLVPPNMQLENPIQFPVAEACLSCIGSDGTEFSTTAFLNLKFVQWTNRQTPIFKDVFANSYRMKGANALKEARELANSKQFRGADHKLERAIADLSSSGCLDYSMITDVLRDLVEARALVQSDITWKRGGDAHFASVSYSHSTQTPSMIVSRYASKQQEQMVESLRRKNRD